MNRWTGPEIFGEVTERFDAFLVKTLAEEGEKTMIKKKQFAVIVLAAVLLLALAATALALGLSRSTHATAVRAAKEAIYAKYGFAPQTFGLFVNWDSWDDHRIVFEAEGADPERLGSYTVELTPGEQPVATWTHDGVVDLAELATRGLDSPVWGAKQAELVLALKKEQQEKSIEMQSRKDWVNWTLEDRASADAALLEKGGADGMYIVHILPSAEDIQEGQAVALAQKAAKEKYGVTEEILATYEPMVEFMRRQDEEGPIYRVWLGVFDRAANSVQVYFDVEIGSPSGEIKRCRGFAFKLPEGDLSGYKEAVEEFVRDGEFAKLPAAQKADVGKRIIEAGFGELIGNVEYVGLEATEISEDAAIQAAKKALLDLGFTEQTLALFDATAVLRRDGDETVWTLTLQPNEERLRSIDPPDGARDSTRIQARMGEYTVTVDPQDGKTRPVVWSLAEQADDTAYTARNWGTAPAIPVRALPFVAELSERYHAVYDPYMARDGFATLEESAAMHALFRDAGFDPKIVSSALPGPGDLTREEAMKIALDAITEEYGVAEKDLRENYKMFEEFDISDPEHPTWYFGPQNMDGWYGVVMDARTGEILLVNYMTGGNG